MNYLSNTNPPRATGRVGSVGTMKKKIFGGGDLVNKIIAATWADNGLAA